MRVILILIAGWIFSLASFTAEAEELTQGLALKAGILIEIRSFDRDTETFCFFSVKFPGEGDSFATVQALADAVGTLPPDKILENPDALVGKQFKTSKELATVEGETLEDGHPGCTLG
jgi:hypothetical protein